MFQFSLNLKQISKDTLRLAMPIGFRIILLVIAGVFTAAMIAFGSVSWFTLVIIILCLIASIYQDTWIFDRETGTAEHRLGLFLLCTRKTIPLTDIRNVEFNRFARGSLDYLNNPETPPRDDKTTRILKRGGILKRPAQHIIEIRLLLRGGGKENLETAKGRHYDYFIDKAEKIAAFIDVPVKK